MNMFHIGVIALVLHVASFLISRCEAAHPGTCAGRCHMTEFEEWDCQCDSLCQHFGDCCPDYAEMCLTCAGRCDVPYHSRLPCQCHWACAAQQSCCQDQAALCLQTPPITDVEVRQLSEQLLAADVNNYGEKLQIDAQGQIDNVDSAEDSAADALFKPDAVSDDYLSTPTVAALKKLFDNYHAYVATAEDFEEGELGEIDAFLSEVARTEVFSELRKFIQTKSGSPTTEQNLVEYLREIWFSLYCRGSVLFSESALPNVSYPAAVSASTGGNEHRDSDGVVDQDPKACVGANSKRGSSGFEHVFMVESTNTAVTGLHNWLFFYEAEKALDLDYRGHKAVSTLANNKGILMEVALKYKYQLKKSVSTLFLGASPELELALYTACFLTRPNALCPVSLAGLETNVQTYVQTANENGKPIKYVGSAFVTIPPAAEIP